MTALNFSIARFCLASNTKPAFSSTRPLASLLSKSSASDRNKKSNLSKAQSEKAVTASLAVDVNEFGPVVGGRTWPPTSST